MKCVKTWVDAEVVVTSPHAGGCVGDGEHVGVELHGAQRVLRGAVHREVMVQVALGTERRTHVLVSVCL